MDRQTLRAKLIDIFEQETWQRPESLDDDVAIREGLNLDSVDVLSIALRVESEIGVSLDSGDFAKIQTVGGLLDTIQAKLAAKDRARAA
ncbi:MAG TPA: acyl carrier protein [Pirellulaceae bacterium]|nr:acyl carrier protein [Pirellulaceae bacterium]